MAGGLEILSRTPDVVEFWSGPPTVAARDALQNPASSIEFSPDASLLAVVHADGVSLRGAATRAEQRRLPVPGVVAVSFSPRGTYLATFQRPSPKATDGSTAEPNLKVWRVASGEVALALHQKSFTRDAWPSVHFAADESLAAHMVGNAVNIYGADLAAGVARRLPLKGVAAIAVSPGPTPVLSVYVAESKGSPGHVALYPCSAPGPAGDAPPPLCRKSFYRANAARFLWNSKGSAVLVATAADVDATNQSYYGEQRLYYLAADGSNECAVPLPKEGPIHDVEWSPLGDYFVAVAGFMPAKSTLFTEKCVPKYDLGSGPYSTVRWNPFGRFFVLAGIGNLPGDLAFFDKKADGKCKPMGTTRAENGVTLEWSPCGRYVLSATVAPRLRVDNGFQVFKYDGTLLARERKDVLLQATWVPAAPGAYEDRPQTPRAGGTAGAVAAPAALPPQPVKASGYVPPHLRGNPAAAAASSASFSLARDANDKGGRIKVGQTSATRTIPGGGLPPGAALEGGKAASKNAKRRANKKKAEGAGEAADGVAGLRL